MKPYKELRKKLNKKFVNPWVGSYPVMAGIAAWVSQSGITCTAEHIKILCKISGGVFYPYQKADRKKIRKYLKRNKKC